MASSNLVPSRGLSPVSSSAETGEKYSPKAEVLPSQKEVEATLSTILNSIEKNGEVIKEVSRKGYCRVRIAEKASLPTLEFRFGTKEQIQKPDNLVFEGESPQITHVVFDPDKKKVFEIRTANIQRQRSAALGPIEYLNEHTIYSTNERFYSSSIKRIIDLSERSVTKVEDISFYEALKDILPLLPLFSK